MATGVDAVGRCLKCGGRGAYPARADDMNPILCERCEGTGLDPRRDDPWFVELAEPAQRDEGREA